MNTQHKKNRLTIVVIFAMSIVPFGIAWYMAVNPATVKLGTNNGELITPPATTEPSDFTGYDDFSAQNIKELQGHWVLLNTMSNAVCAKPCEEGLHKTHQITLMMGKDIARIRRLAVIFDPSTRPLPKPWQDDMRLLKIVPSAGLKATIANLPGAVAPGSLLIMDPLGNLMMRYDPGYDPYKVRNDLSKLLRISQIG